MNSIYLDHAATTPMHPAVIEKYTEHLHSLFGNPSSIHQHGREARKWLDQSRKIFADSIHSEPNEIIFTSGGTEADNIAILGTVQAYRHKGNHIITTNIEHPAVLQTCKRLEIDGFEVTYLEVNRFGQITVQQVKEALREDTILVSIMLGNNEVGSIQPIAEIGKVLETHQTVFHTDAVQAFGILPIHVEQLGVDLLSVSAHKINGPKGVGFLFQRKGIETTPLLYGGEQERKRRAGTENVPAIIAFAEAVTIACQNMTKNQENYRQYEQIFIETFTLENIDFVVNGSEERLPHILNISFPGTDIESLLVNLDMDSISASSGSACTAGSLDPSHVLSAMFGEGAPELRNSVRFSFGLGLDLEQIQKAAHRIASIVKRLVK